MQDQIKSYTNLNLFAANYDCNTYGSGTYNNNDCATTTGGGSGGGATNPDDGLAGTGFDVIMLAAFAFALIAAGLGLLIKKLVRRFRSHSH